MSIALELFCRTVAVTMPLAAELSILIGVSGRVKPSSWSVVICRGTAVLQLWNSPPTSDLAADSTICLRILHYVCIGPFAGGRRFGDFSGQLVVISGNSSLHCGCVPVALIGMMHHCKCKV